jgi:hypothetical protein
MRRKMMQAAVAFALLLGAHAAQAQETFDGEGYTLALPNETWRAVPRSDSVHQHTEFINGERSEGYLRIRKEVIESDMTLSAFARHEQDTKLRFVNGFIGGKEERFAGRLNGIVVSYEYTSAGKPMAGLIYYLKADGRNVYALHFTGRSDKLLRIRPQTDSIARSFNVKQ